MFIINKQTLIYAIFSLRGKDRYNIIGAECGFSGTPCATRCKYDIQEKSRYATSSVFPTTQPKTAAPKTFIVIYCVALWYILDYI